ncbi:dynein regulatory complex protein 11-like [Ischnura elegans]|uniref:dynein regulatory complex protein 11-like n=1 Tax=Ischnura elegans TaxID=197161 RepID=UPI001ED88DBF|nr:dynein regulatory complex protein 11-like [Ischnura elegans]
MAECTRNNFFYAKEHQKLWDSAQADLKRIVYAEDELQKAGEIEDKWKEYNILGSFYLQYVKAINKLGDCYDQIVHPQKRIIIRKLLDACLCRFLEVKNRMVQLSLDDINLLDQTCINEKMIPFDAEVRIPSYFTRDDKYERKDLKHLLDQILRSAASDDPPMTDEAMTDEPMTFTRALLIIVKHERVRQAQKKYDEFYKLWKLKEIGRLPSLAKDDGGILTGAATVIQKTWRGYKCRKAFLKRKEQELVLIGIKPPLEYSDEAQKKVYETRIKHHMLQRHREARFRQHIPGDKPRQIMRKKRRMLTKLRNKDKDWYYRNVLFRRRPSFQAFDEEHPPAKERIETKLLERRFIPPKPKKKEAKKGKKKGKKKKKEKEEKKGSKEEKKGEGPLERPILRKQQIWEAQEYKKSWQGKDEHCNFLQVHDLYPTKRKNFERLKKDVRKIINDLMLVELKRLQTAIKDYHSKKKKKGKKGKKKGKKKKKKGGKKKKGKGDLTAGRSFESLFEELILNGVIRSYPETRISAFNGELSLIGQDLEALGKPTVGSLGDVRKLIKEYCILPMGSGFVHKNAPFVKSLLITGPEEVGKHTILNAICTELDAFLFDITNENIAESYPDKAALKMLVHLVTKMSRILQPSIIFFDQAERAFIKKVPKGDESNPRRLKAVLPKITKGIKAADRVMLIGITSRPFDAKQRGMNKTYQKVIYIPRPSYADMSQHWNDTLCSYGHLNHGFDCHTMSKMSNGYNLSSISRVVEKNLTCIRLLSLGFKKLQPEEFFQDLIEEAPHYDEGEAKFFKFIDKCPLNKKKRKYLKNLEEEKNPKGGKKK